MSHDTEEWFKEMLILENMHFLCDAIDLKQSVGGSLNVSGKSLTTVSDEFILYLICLVFPYPWSPKANPSFVKVNYLLPSQAEQLPKLPSLFLLAPLFWGYLGSQVAINEMVSNLDYHPCPSRLASRIHPVLFL